MIWAMKWFSFAILAVLTIVFQTTVVQAMAIHSVWPNWMFILAVHYALWGPWPDAAMAAWTLGLIMDLFSGGRIGLNAFCFGGAAWAIMHLRQVMFRDHPMTQILVTLLFMLVMQGITGLYYCWDASVTIPWKDIGWSALFTALYTAAWAPYLHWPLIRLERWTGLRGTLDPMRR